MDRNLLLRMTWILCFILIPTVVVSDCVWYGQCGNNPHLPAWYNKKVNCEYHGKARPLTSTHAINQYATLCPDLFVTQGIYTCCSAAQINTLSEQISIGAQILKRCPSCIHNFLNIWCYMTCSTNNAQFTSINKTVPYHTRTFSGNAITKLNYYLHPLFAHDMFDSCKDVTFPPTQSLALDILCGTSASQCTVQKWLDFMGNTANGVTPFDIAFTITYKPIPPTADRPRTLIPLNANTTPCNKAPTVYAKECSCEDCKPACNSCNKESTIP